jgi:hypothetical protein
MEAATGVMGIVHNVYFLDYKTAKPMLEAFAELAGDDVPTETDWDRLRHLHLIEVAGQYRDGLRAEKKDLVELYGDIEDGVKVMQRAVQGATAAYILHVGTAGVLPKLFMYTLGRGTNLAWKAAKSTPGKIVAGETAFALLFVYEASPEFRKAVDEGLRDLAELTLTPPVAAGAWLTAVTNWALATPQRAERLGRLIGVLKGGSSLNRDVFGEEKPWREGWKSPGAATRHIQASFVRSSLKTSPVTTIVQLLTFHFVYVFEKSKPASVVAAMRLQDRIAAVLFVPEEEREIFGDRTDLTLGKLLLLLVEVEAVLRDWVKDMAQIPELTQHIVVLADTIKVMEPSKLPTFEQLREGDDPGDWLCQAITFVALTHLHASLRRVIAALRTLEEPVNPKAERPVSVADLLKILGFQHSDAELGGALDRGFDDLVPPPPPPGQFPWPASPPT